MAQKRYPMGTYMQVVAGKALRRRRQALDLTLREVAKLMGRENAYTFIGRLEREVVNTCTKDFARSLAAVLQRDVEELFMPRMHKSDGRNAHGSAVRRAS